MFNKAAAKVSIDHHEEGVTVRSEKVLSEHKTSQLKKKVLCGNFIKVNV